MLQLHNKTPFAASLCLLPNEQGVDTAYVLVSASFDLGESWQLSEDQPEPTEADEYVGEPGHSSLRVPSEYHLGKTATDIIVVGDVFTPEARPHSQLDVSISVDQISKTLRIFGDRVWEGGRPSDAKPFVRLPLCYERAYGGEITGPNGEVIDAFESNPIGCGYSGDRPRQQCEGLSIPNIEDPASLISTLADQPVPAGFGAIPPNWFPRTQWAGTYDDNWVAERAPYLPQDFDKQFFSCAHPDLIYPGFLRGGESVSLTHMHPNGPLNFRLPRIDLRARAYIKNEIHQPDFNLETVVIEPNDLKVRMCWRAALHFGKSVADFNCVELLLVRHKAAA